MAEVEKAAGLFGTLEKIRADTTAELGEVIGRKLARSLQDALRKRRLKKN